jgi:uncharacterized protein
MHALFRPCAFESTSSREACVVESDKEATTLNDIDNGVVNSLVGFAPV